MVSPSVGAVILVPFPFSDLTHSKLRPAIVLAQVTKEDCILAQITSNPYADPLAIALNDEDFSFGSLKRISYVRPGKLFTAHLSLIVSQVAIVKNEKYSTVVDSVIGIFRSSSPNR